MFQYPLIILAGLCNKSWLLTEKKDIYLFIHLTPSHRASPLIFWGGIVHWLVDTRINVRLLLGGCTVPARSRLTLDQKIKDNIRKHIISFFGKFHQWIVVAPWITKKKNLTETKWNNYRKLHKLRKKKVNRDHSQANSDPTTMVTITLPPPSRKRVNGSPK